MPRSVLLLLWLIALVLLVGGLGTPVVTRTQEARVLETAREMLGADARGWMVPRLNGELRLQKPPLAYWASAVSFRCLGVNELAGRLPFVLAAWSTLAFGYRIAARLMGARAGFVAACATLTMFMFFRHARLAETDVLAGLFVTVAVDCFLMAGSAGVSMGVAVVVLHAGALACGLAAMAKGPPALFPIIFMIAWCAVERDWRVAKRFAISGAWLTLAIVAGWWFYTISRTPDWQVIRRELDVVTGGEDHGGPFYSYFGQILGATLPWSGLFVMGIVWGISRWRTDRAARALLIWFGAIFVPLCCVGNKQYHYLVPLMPACGGLVAYAIGQALQSENRKKTVRVMLIVMIVISGLGAVGSLAAARLVRGFYNAGDLLVAVLVLCAAIASWSMLRRNGLMAGIITYSVGVTLVFTAIFGRWWPSLDLVTHRDVARQLHEAFAEGRYCFYGKDLSYPLIFNMRQVIPRAQTKEELEGMLAKDPRRIVIVQTKNKQAAPALPEDLEARGSIDLDAGNTLRIYARP